MRKCLFLFVSFLLLIDLIFSIIPQAEIGINLPTIGPSTTACIFTDIFKHAAQFRLYQKSVINFTNWTLSSTFLDLSINGYPAFLPSNDFSYNYSAVSEIGFRNGRAKGKQQSAGKYIVLQEGEGELQFEDDATILNEDKVLKRIIINITPDTCITIRLIKTNNLNPLKNIRVIPEAFEKTQNSINVFAPKFVDSIKKFKTLRFCQWQNEIKSNRIFRGWSNRTTPENFSQQDENMGITLEYMILLANQINANSWFCFPYFFDENYAREFALLLKNTLNPNLKIFVEWSNSLGFNQEIGLKTAALSDIFQDIFGPERKASQVIVVASATDTNYIPHILNYFTNLQNKVDAIAIEGSFGNDLGYNSEQLNFTVIEDLTEQSIHEIAKHSVLVSQVKFLKSIQLAKINNLSLIVYSGGPFFQAPSNGYRAQLKQLIQSGAQVPNQTLEELVGKEAKFAGILMDVNRDSMIKEAYMDSLRRWFAIGGLTFIGSLMDQAPDLENEGYSALCEDMNLHSEKCPKFAALLRQINGESSIFPYTSDDIPDLTQKCSPECIWGTCFRGICECFSGQTGTQCNETTSKPNNCTNAFGTNIDQISYWTAEWKQVNLFKMSSDWVTQEFNSSTWNTNKLSQISMKTDGYPSKLPLNTIVGALMVRDLKQHQENGTQICLYDGDGVLDFGLNDVKKVTRKVGRIELDVQSSNDPNNGIFVKILWTNPTNPIRNIRVIWPGFEKRYMSFPFHPLFLQHLERFKTIRFMDFLATNSVSNENFGKWENRITPKNRTYFTNGSSLEDMILLANTLGTDIYFNMPHVADNNQIENAARLLFSSVRPDVKIYVEFSNEAWGTLFPGGIYAQSMGLKLNFSTDPNKARWCYIGFRSKQIFQIMKNVFGDQKNRIISVLAGQAAWTEASKNILECNNAYQFADALAIAPYFDGNLTLNNCGDDQYLESLDTLMNVNLPAGIARSIGWTANHYILAKKYGLKFITQECGQGMVGGSSVKQQELAQNANRDLRMKKLQLSQFQGLKDNGIELILHQTSIYPQGKYGSWGMMEYQNDDPSKAPKYMAIQEYIKSTSLCTNFPEQTDCPGDNCNGLKNGICLKNGRCSCFPGNLGFDCSNQNQNDLVECDCNNNGACQQTKIEGNYRYFSCKCKNEYRGSHCNLPACRNQCNQNGICISSNKCKCFEGQYGEYCENDCGCKAHGKCNAQNTCDCDEGFRWNNTSKSCEFNCGCNKCIGPNECACKTECVNGQCFNGKCKCYEGFTGIACANLISRYRNATQVGMNLAFFTDWSTQQPFLDLFKGSRPWLSQVIPGIEGDTWEIAININYDANGYPQELPIDQALGTIINCELNGHQENGTFFILYEGNGRISAMQDSKIVNERKGRIEINVMHSLNKGNGIWLKIYDIDRENPIRNIRLVKKEYEYLQERLIFHPLFLKRFAMFDSFRFMDWGAINDNPESSWDQRVKPINARQTWSNGISQEQMILLSNMLRIDPWFCIPTEANDDQVSNFAKMLKEKLRADLTIYLEQSNEMWNPSYILAQTHAKNEGERLGIRPTQYYSKRSLEIFRIIITIFGPENRNRLKFILTSHTDNLTITKEILEYSNSSLQVDALGIAFYQDCDGIGSPKMASQIPDMKIEEILDICEKGINENMLQDAILQKELAKKQNLPIIFQEIGTFISEIDALYSEIPTPGAAEKYIAVNRHPKMQSIYLSLLQKMNTNGLLNDFPIFIQNSMGWPSFYGSWGVLEYMDQQAKDAPKQQALLKFMEDICCNLSSTKLIKGLGGNLSLGKLDLKINPKALQGDLTIEVKHALAKNEKSIVQQKLGPPGTKFDEPVKICLNLTKELLTNAEIKGYSLFGADDDEQIWVRLNNSYQNGYQVCGDMAHFSNVAIMEDSEKDITIIGVKFAMTIMSSLVLNAIILVCLLLI